MDDLLQLLRAHWGYDAFRPRQEAIVRSILNGEDVAVVMPTGGGKSLCYQLPPLVAGRTAIVISPLIALMQDQVMQLGQMGIPAAFLNSAMPPADQHRTMIEARRGAYRLLYLSPERLAREDTVHWLRNVPVGFFAIDEAHCISEWGHEFRPEYRQLSRLRTEFPDCPIAAFTASATQRVRHDILAQLQLREPRKFIMSFFRPNLRYVVRETSSGEQERLLVAALQAHIGCNVIVYAPTIARVEEIADSLSGRGIPAVAYHGRMEAPERRANQERWMSDEVRVLVGTIAFGLGINKPNVRAVIHLSLPKSVEQYYQEAGRAGRDGLPADCLLLWRKQDAGLLAHFIEQVTDRAERERCWQRYNEIRRFAEQARCRHRQICLHFGETPKWTECSSCDVCAGMLEWLAVKAAPAVKRSKARKAVAARPQDPVPAPQPAASVPQEPDAELMEYLREWRRETAKARGVPAFIVLHDASLADLCRRKPSSLAELERVHGIGRGKAESLGARILEALRTFQQGVRARPVPASSPSPAEQTVRLLEQGKSFAEIARARGRQRDTVITQVADRVESGRLPFDPAWLNESLLTEVGQAAVRLGFERLKPIKEAVSPEITYPEIRLVVAYLRSRAGQLPTPV